jgi:Tfp pilus assembly protein PilF
MFTMRWFCVLTLSLTVPAICCAEELAGLGQQALLRNDPQQAVVLYTKAIQNNPAEASSYRGRAEAYQELEKFDLALADLNTCLRLQPQNAVALAVRARVWLRTGHNREAIADATASLQM